MKEPAGDSLPNPRDPAVFLSLVIATLFGVYLLITSTTNPVPAIYWLYDAKRILQFALLLLLFLVPAANGRIRQETASLMDVIPRGIKFVLLALFSWGVVSVLFNAQSLMHGLNSFSEVALLSALVLGIFVVAACRRIAGRWFDQIAIGLIALTGLAVGLQELIGVVAAQNAGVDFTFRVSLLHFSWPRFYNQVQSWTIPALVALPLLFSKYRLSIFISALVLGLQWYIILMTAGRGTFVAVLIACGVALVLLPAIRSRLVMWQLSGILIGGLVYAAVLFSFEVNAPGSEASTMQPTSQSTVERSADADENAVSMPEATSGFYKQSLGKPMMHTSGRTEMWKMTLEDARAHPLVGIGPMNYVCTSPKPIDHPHNFPLQLAAEWGFPTAFTVCALFGFLWWQAAAAIRQRVIETQRDSIMASLLLTGVLAAAIHACLSGVMVMPASQVTGLLVSGMLLGLFPLGQSFRKPGHSAKAWAPGLILAVFLLVLGANELLTMQDREVLLEPKDAMYPRIWQDSKVCQLYNLQNEVNN